MAHWNAYKSRLLAGVLLCNPLPAWTQATAAPPVAADAAPLPVLKEQAYAKDPDLAELRSRLAKVILPILPNVRCGYDQDDLVFYNYSDKYPVHLFGSLKSTLPATNTYPPAYDEFVLELSAGSDVMHYRKAPPLQSGPQPYGERLETRYNLRSIDPPSMTEMTVAIPREYKHFYRDLDTLGGAFKNPPVPRPFITRYEMAVAAVRIMMDMSNPEAPGRSPLREGALDEPKALSALNDFKAEFSPDMTALGVKVVAARPLVDGLSWQPRCDYVTVTLSYGAGMDSVLIAFIQKTISDYADECMAAHNHKL